jgi:methylated-DNA-[protein]-cysteine S-methyltransferase
MPIERFLMTPATPGALVRGRIPSPLGELLVLGRDGSLTGLFVADHERCPSPGPEWVEDDRTFADVAHQLHDYFDGARTRFDLRVHLAGSPFERCVWQALRDVPFGQTISYAELAKRIGQPRAARAVGAANARNPISVIVPCHRVIGADGALTGYGWGTARKAWLLDHERRVSEGAASKLAISPVRRTIP